MKQAKVGDSFDAWLICYEGKPATMHGMLQIFRAQGTAQANRFAKDQLVKVKIKIVAEAKARRWR